MSEQETHKLALELEKLRTIVESTNTAVRMGHSTTGQKIEALSADMKNHLAHCGQCKEDTRQEIRSVELLARQLVKEMSKEIGGQIRTLRSDIEPRLREVENWRGKMVGMGVVISALASGVALGLKYLAERMLS